MEEQLTRTLNGVPLLATIAVTGILSCSAAKADDTEIYKAVFGTDQGYKPHVIILFDDSGSMGNEKSAKPRYDESEDYGGSVPADRVYWSTSSQIPDADSEQYFVAEANQCASSEDRLDNKGFFLASGALRWYDPVNDEDTCGPYSCPDGQTYYEFDPTGGTADDHCWTTSSTSETQDVWVYTGDYRFGCSNGGRAFGVGGYSPVQCYEEVESAAGVTGYIEREDDNARSCDNPDYTLLLKYTGFFGGDWGCYEEVTGVVTEPGETSYTDQGAASRTCDGEVTTGSWLGLSSGAHQPKHVECYDDIENADDNNQNYNTDGYPQDNVNDGSEYGPNIDTSIAWGDEPYYFYTSNYMNWHHDTNDEIAEEQRTKLDIAQEVVEDIVYTTPSVDFGLLEFNYEHGGRFTQRVISNMDDANITLDGETRDGRENMIYLVNELIAGGATPMCESLYEAYLYLARSAPYWYNQRNTNGSGRDPQPYDSAAIANGLYDPPESPCANTYLILMTDGKPYFDVGSNDDIKSLNAVGTNGQDVNPSGSNGNCTIYPDDDPNTNVNWSLTDADGNTTSGSGGGEYCMPELAEYMANNDLDDNSDNGIQYAKTYTIGFDTNQQILRDTAGKGEGLFYEAADAQALRDAFRDTLLSILADETTFTSPAVAVDTFTRTQSRNEIFYAMFEPSTSVDWPGNIKKLTLELINGEAVLLDGTNTPALDSNTGDFLSTAQTVWSSEPDGGSVTKGGLGGLLANLDNLSTRNLWINTGPNGALEAFNTENIDAEAMGVNSDFELYQLFGTSSADAFAKQIAWGQGYDAYNEDGDSNGDTTDNRPWILGDILHSQPLVVNYGALGDASIEEPDLRIISGTNAGWVHMFDNSDGSESWAFFPKELASKMPLRRADAESTSNVYGMDLTATLYAKDLDADGTIDSDDGDQAWIFLGQRRGGKSYYALDISDPDSPSFMWMINSNVSGFSEMGLTFSQPVVTTIPGYFNEESGVPKPVLIFGAGYAINKDSASLGSDDGEGRGIYIVDAASGALVWSVTPAPDSAKNLSEPDLDHSVPASVTVLDSNGDQLTDRIYFGDTGGYLWRVDLAGNELPDGGQDTWRVTMLGDFSGEGTLSDRRFFNAPDVVRVRIDGQAVDAVIIGTGDRTNPNGTDVDNSVYMIRDIATSVYANPEPATCTDDSVDFRCQLPITENDLFDITSNEINEGTDTEQLTASDELSAASGWKFDLVNVGEKSLAKTLSIDGKVYVPSFTPSTEVFDDGFTCGPTAGTGIMYIIDIYDGQRALLNMGSIIPDTPSIHVAADGKIRLLLPPGTPAASATEPGDVECEGGICDVFESIKPPYGNYWFQGDY